MTTDRDIAPLIRSWLHDEPDEPSEHVLDRALAVVDLTPQRSAARWPARRPDMNLIVRLGVAAAVMAMAVALGYGILQNVGTVTPEPAPSDDASPASGALPAELTHIFIGATREVPGIEVDDRLVIDLTTSIFRLHTGIGRTAVVSAASMAESGVLRLETVVGTTECADGDVGSYPYSLSPGGTVLTITSGDDDCVPRADALVGEWRRSECRDPGNWCLGELEAGSQTSLFFDPYLAEFGQPVSRYGGMTYEVPDGWANADDRTHFYTLLKADSYTEATPFDCLDCPDGVWIGADPAAITLDCTEEPDDTVGTSAQELADWIRAHPGLDVTEGPALSVDGRPTFVLDVAGSESYADACTDPDLDLTFTPMFSHPGYGHGIRTGDRSRLFLVEIDADRAMLIGVDSFDPDDLEAVVAETQPIIESIRLTPP